MKVLLLHPEDNLLPGQSQGFDLIVDLGRASSATYEKWRKQAGCRIVSLADYARGFEDIFRLTPAFHHAEGIAIDKAGIDWWYVLLPMLSTTLERCFMLVGLARELGSAIELHSSRPDANAFALQKYLGVERIFMRGNTSTLGQKIQHYRRAFSHLDANQVTQIIQDKFDPQHQIRRHLKGKEAGTSGPFFLLPTAYINVSRAAVSYATVLPTEQFLLVVARSAGKLAPLPANVQMISLDPYFSRIDRLEINELTERWGKLKNRLTEAAPEFRVAEALGMFQHAAELIRWGLPVRDAWMRLFESVQIAGCLSADDANPYTSLPLFIAGKRGVPALAVHHGAIDGRLAMRPVQSDYYLAKGELEKDYLLETCHANPKKIVMGGPPHALPEPVKATDKPWLVFFTEPYGSAGWRMQAVYEELLSPLCALAAQCGLKLVFKLHPFESIKGHKNLVRRFLSAEQLREIQWIDGPITSELWNKVRFGVAVESTVALECAIRQIPIFLCSWLQHVYGSYIQQYAKFGLGHILNSPDEIKNIPQLLAAWKTCEASASGKIWQTIEPAKLHNLLTGKYQRDPATPLQVSEIGSNRS